jgi:NTE family protein
MRDWKHELMRARGGGRRVTRTELADQGFDWVFQDTFLADLKNKRSSPLEAPQDHANITLCSTPFADVDLSKLEMDEEDILKVATEKIFPPGKEIWTLDSDTQRGLLLLLDGEVDIAIHDPQGLEHRTSCKADGLLLWRDPDTKEEDPLSVSARGEVVALYVPQDELNQLLVSNPSLKSFLSASVLSPIVRRRLLEAISLNPTLRLLSRADQLLLLIDAQLIDRPATSHDCTIFESGGYGVDPYLVVKGAVEIRSSSRGGGALETLQEGSLFGADAVLLERTRPLAAVIPAQASTTVLRLSGRRFMEITDRNSMVARKILRNIADFHIKVGPHVAAASRTSPRHYVILVTAADEALPILAAAYGIAGSLTTSGAPYRGLRANQWLAGQSTHLQAQSAGRTVSLPPVPVVLVDPRGAESAADLGFDVIDATVAGVAVNEMRLPEAWNPERLRVVWPKRPTGYAALIGACHEGKAGWRKGQQLVVADPPDVAGHGARHALLIRRADVVVHGRSAQDPPPTQSTGRGGTRPRGPAGQAWVQLIDMRGADDDARLELRDCCKASRLPADAHGCVDRLWGEGDLDAVSSPETSFGRACGRASRLVRGSSVALALGGGGAFGFMHAGLVCALDEHGFDIDVVAGVSFGSLVGALLVSGGVEDVTRVEEMWKGLVACSALGVLFRDTFAAYVDRALKGQRLRQTEIPLYPVGADVSVMEPFVLTRGTLGQAVQSASSVPGLLRAFKTGKKSRRRIVDGVVVDNVPAVVAWQAGADFVLGSNVVPIEDKASLIGRVRQGLSRLPLDPLVRLDDGIRSLYHMGGQMGRDRARLADMLFDSNLRGIDFYEFWRAREIMTCGYEQAISRMDDIIAAYDHDPARRF